MLSLTESKAPPRRRDQRQHLGSGNIQRDGLLRRALDLGCVDEVDLAVAALDDDAVEDRLAGVVHHPHDLAGLDLVGAVDGRPPGEVVVVDRDSVVDHRLEHTNPGRPARRAALTRPLRCAAATGSSPRTWRISGDPNQTPTSTSAIGTVVAIAAAAPKRKSLTSRIAPHIARPRKAIPAIAEPVAGEHDVLLVAPAEAHPVPRRRPDQADRGERRRDQRPEIDALLEVGDPGEALLKGQHEQEGEQDLHAGQRHSQAREQLVEVAVQALGLVLVIARIRLAFAVGLLHAPTLPPPGTLNRRTSRSGGRAAAAPASCESGRRPANR